MKTVCIKTNNSKTIDYLLENLNDIDLNDVYLSTHQFKTFHNIFIHYKGNNLELFLSTVCNILTSLVFDNYEDSIAKNILQREYFYFDTMEQREILEKFEENSYDDMESFTTKENVLFNTFYNFIKNSDKIYLKGFITFRLKKYREELEKQVDSAINQYLIEKEYLEFVSLLKLYVNSEPTKSDLVHLVCHDEELILLDKNKNIIETDINLLNAKYLSDISFSSSDMILNTLLSIVPKKIYIHLVDKEADEFINTLCLIFDGRISLCNDCNICRIFKSRLKHSNLK